MRKSILLIVFILLLGVIYFSTKSKSVAPLTNPPSIDNKTQQTKPVSNDFKIEVIAQGLDTPWALAFAPDGRLFITERPGRVRIIKDGKLQNVKITIPGVYEQSESGLMGIAVHPDFDSNHYVYVYHTYRRNGTLLNRTLRFTEKNNSFTDQKIILDNIPGNTTHDGGRIKFGPDQKLYITVGDVQDRQSSQDKNILTGKILRINDDGSIPKDNPYNNAVWSYGHRNPQGLAWHPTTQELFSTEHGPSAHDEVNIIQKGANYGWPLTVGDQTRESMVTPIQESGINTWAPAGATFYSGNKLGKDFQNTFIFTGLRSNTLWRLKLNSDNKTVESMDGLLEGEWGRMRDVIEGPDGYLYIANSNQDGRGRPDQVDDRILILKPN